MTNFGRDLGNESTQTPDERRAEADRIINIFDGYRDEMTLKENEFIDQMDNPSPVSPKQLFWLRDIKAKYCE